MGGVVDRAKFKACSSTWSVYLPFGLLLPLKSLFMQVAIYASNIQVCRPTFKLLARFCTRGWMPRLQADAETESRESITILIPTCAPYEENQTYCEGTHCHIQLKDIKFRVCLNFCVQLFIHPTGGKDRRQKSVYRTENGASILCQICQFRQLEER